MTGLYFVAGFFAVLAIIGILIALLEFAAWSGSPTPSQSSMSGIGCGLFVIAVIAAAVFAIAGALS